MPIRQFLNGEQFDQQRYASLVSRSNRSASPWWPKPSLPNRPLC